MAVNSNTSGRRIKPKISIKTSIKIKTGKKKGKVKGGHKKDSLSSISDEICSEEGKEF